MGETTYYQKNWENILNRTRDYYKNNKKVLRGKAKSKYRELSEKESNIKREYGRNRYKNKIIMHKIGTYDVCKISLSFFDDKRCILDDDINTLA